MRTNLLSKLNELMDAGYLAKDAIDEITELRNLVDNMFDALEDAKEELENRRPDEIVLRKVETSLIDVKDYNNNLDDS